MVEDSQNLTISDLNYSFIDTKERKKDVLKCLEMLGANKNDTVLEFYSVK